MGCVSPTPSMSSLLHLSVSSPVKSENNNSSKDVHFKFNVLANVFVPASVNSESSDVPLPEGPPPVSTSSMPAMLTSLSTTSWSRPSCPGISSLSCRHTALVTLYQRGPAKTFKMNAFLLLWIFSRIIPVQTCSHYGFLFLIRLSIFLSCILLWAIILINEKFSTLWSLGRTSISLRCYFISP